MIPREPLQLRRAARVHRRAARGRPAAHHASPTCRGRSACPDVRFRRPDPLPAVVGAVLTFVLWIVALATHAGARIAGPLWLAARAGRLRRSCAARAASGLLERVEPADERGPRARGGGRVQRHPRADEARHHRRGDARDRGQARRGARRPGRGAARRSRSRSSSRSTPSSTSEEERAASLARRGAACSPRSTASRSRRTSCARARSATRSSTEAARPDADLILLGSSPRWRRQSRFFSPTVDYVLRKAPCEVHGRGLPAGRPRGGRAEAARLRSREGDRGRLRPGRLDRREAPRATRAGRSPSSTRREEALARLGEDWAGGFIVGHGMDAERAARGRASRTPTPSSSRPTATTRTSSSARSRSSSSRSDASSCRILDPRRAEFYASRGLQRRLPDARRRSRRSSADVAAQAARGGRRR